MWHIQVDMGVLESLLACTGFDWDEGNLLKNWEKHGVTVAECEQVFFNRPLLATRAGRNAGATSTMVKKRAKSVPKFKSEDQERDFWSDSDSTEYVDWSEARPLVLPNLKPSLKTISLRLPEHMLAELKVLANKRDIPYQSLLKLFLAEKLEEELQRIGPP